jgi:GNAT superfamily N-acetyltransferase
VPEELVVRRVAAEELRELRRRVLRENDPARSVRNPLDDDASTWHFGGFLGERLVVSASFFRTEAPVHPELVSYQLRYMATDVDVQGRGYGAAVLAAAEAALRDAGVEQVWAHARDTALGFYGATGWNVLEGSAHMSAETALPHTTILKMLVPVIPT